MPIEVPNLNFTSSISTHQLRPNQMRPAVRGKFIFAGDQKLYIRGVTYGPFRPDGQGCEYHTPDSVTQDFQRMAAAGFNAVRTYTPPPRWLLDIAQQNGLWVLIGLPWEQHIAFLDGTHEHKIIERVRCGVEACAGHPALLAYAIGNEIPATIVRWHGPRRVERFLHKLYHAVKKADSDALVTYVNYPTTEYLKLPFLDFVSFNVYLESQERLDAYLARLQNLAGDKPLVMAEIGLDSQRNGQDVQAATLDWQVRTIFAGGGAGAFIFAWTDEWHRGGYDIEDWDFGLTTRCRQPKLALTTVSTAFAETPFPCGLAWPHISVVVCSYNGVRTIGECCHGLQQLDYPNYEVIIVDDGSSDKTATIASRYGFQVIRTPNQGLSKARNTGLQAASGEIVAYLDDDACPDPHWLTYLAATFMNSDYVGVGGPNLTPPDDGRVAHCVANAPGNPTQILVSDHEAEHIPGCNMAFRKNELDAIGGFDSQFRIAGDDVDVCWRLQEAGWKIGFSPAAVVWHHRRNSVAAFWKQQVNYGKAEAMLETKWPEKYNLIGHLNWRGRLYGMGAVGRSLFRRTRIYHGVWGTNLFQPAYEPQPGIYESLCMLPEWYLLIGLMALLSLLGLLWQPLLIFIPLLVIAIGLSVTQAVQAVMHATFPAEISSSPARWKYYGLTAFLQIMQPLARLRGRRQMGLTPWRRSGKSVTTLPWPRRTVYWSERWQSAEDWLKLIEARLRGQGVLVRRGGEFDGWDLEVQAGLLEATRLLIAIEEHGAGKQLVRLRTWPRFSPIGLGLIALFLGSAMTALWVQVWAAVLVLGAISGSLALYMMRDCTSTIALQTMQPTNKEALDD